MTSFYLFECPFHCSGDFKVLSGVDKSWHGAIESSYGATSKSDSSNKYGYGADPLIFGPFGF